MFITDESAIEELISSEQLQRFDIIELYCDICQDITPHHQDDSKVYENSELEITPDTTFSAPLSLKECVRCREEEESRLDI